VNLLVNLTMCIQAWLLEVCERADEPLELQYSALELVGRVYERWASITPDCWAQLHRLLQGQDSAVWDGHGRSSILLVAHAVCLHAHWFYTQEVR